ncbi:MAG TPA: FAD-dependent oxidoreductase [Steroidobacteraceae bacterium]|nr:FAD-dependent oxidoreductase [Steroidobacteraceae bacterium]
MRHTDVIAHSPWVEFPLPEYPALDRDLEVDVVVVGGGVAGLTTAYLLGREGLRVALLERDRLASADTARTTAHLAYVTDMRLHKLCDHFGKEAARTCWQAGAMAIDEIERLVQETSADCGFRRVPGFLHASLRETDEEERDDLLEDSSVAVELGFNARFVERVPGVALPGVRFEGQAKFHPRRYLAALAAAIAGQGSYIFEQTALEEAAEKVVRANGRNLRCDYLVIATHNPIAGRGGALKATLLQTKLALYTSYVLGARLPAGTVAPGVYWDTSDPYYYLRIDEADDQQYAIFGGEDVKTGQEVDSEEIFTRLQARLHELLPAAEVRHRWMGQVIETDDGLPFIGENSEGEFIATGFAGNGFTFATVAAMMARDRLLGRDNPCFDLFRVDRKPFHGGAWRYVKENADYPYHLLRDRMKPAQGESLDELGKGEGKILKLKGDKVAAHRDEKGAVTLLSPVCTHMGCLVRWNAADSTWDCPCHGSRFRPDGDVLGGPAEKPLRRLEADR